jgi:HD-GYP domain-containing protein (c-di-GMP phosphodiesterase class II)
MRTDRAYRRALSQEVARAELRANAGRQFDPYLVEVFLALLEDPGEPAAPPPTLSETTLVANP